MLLLPNLGMPEILLILVVALLIFGPSRLPEIGKSIGKAFREFRRGTSGLVDTLNREMQEPTKSGEGGAALAAKRTGLAGVEPTVLEAEPLGNEETGDGKRA
jgi:sec-independent protein translocase protein TatA